MAENRINREHETREKTTQRKAWQRPEVLPAPNPEPGYEFHWVRLRRRLCGVRIDSGGNA